jgi:predicted RecA/RadA family phage recombinase
MANENAIYRRKGDKINYVCTGAVACGDVIKLASGIVGVAEVGGVENEEIALTVTGVFEFATDGAKIDQGALVYLKSDGKVSATKGSNTLIGVAWNSAPVTSDATVLVKINVGTEPDAAG